MRSLLAALAALALTSPAFAVSDATGDFLPTHAGINAADLDITSTDIINLDLGIVFTTFLAGDFGATPGASYVFGVDRGAGTAGLFSGTPPVGPGVTFDAVVVVRADGSVTVTAFNDSAPPTVTTLADAVFSEANGFATFVDTALLPSRGLAVADYRFNMWTRSGGGNTGIADLAKGEGTFGYTDITAGVPEPATWALFIAGFGLTGVALRRRPARAAGGVR